MSIPLLPVAQFKSFSAPFDRKAANDRLENGILGQHDLADLYDILLEMSNHIVINPGRCEAFGYTAADHKEFLNISRHFLYGMNDPTPADTKKLVTSLSLVCGYFLKEYKMCSNEEAEQNTPSTLMPIFAAHSVWENFHRWHYGDQVNLIQRMKIRLAPATKVELSLADNRQPE
jgi:hypothetical protein